MSHPDLEPRIRASFARQTFMATLGARMESAAPGELWAERAGAEPALVAIMQTTMMTLRDREGLAD